MFRNQYDTDPVTFSPQGRIFQIEYAMEAVKQGSALVGITSKHGAVLASLKRAANELSSHQKKLFAIDDHLGLGMSGLTADGRQLVKYMRNECINYKFMYEGKKNCGRLVQQVADKSQVATQRSWSRPYGVGLLVASYDSNGPHLYQTCPSGNFYEYKAIAMGARSQAARTYLEKTYESFPDMSVEELCKHALLALKESTSDGNINAENTSIAYVTAETPFTLLENEDVQPALDRMRSSESVGPGSAESSGGNGPEPMET